MIKLHQFPTDFGLPNFSPFCMKLEVFLKMADIDYEIVEVNNPAKGPKHKAPFIEDGDLSMGDSELIIAYLQKKHGIDLDQGGKKAGMAAKADYVAHRYHKPQDEYDPNWDWSGVMSDLALFYRIGRMLADSTSWPNWNEGDEFKATRDDQLATSVLGFDVELIKLLNFGVASFCIGVVGGDWLLW